MEMLTKENKSVAKKFNYTRRFIGGLHTLNNDGHSGENKNMGRIYPQELKLSQENQDDDKATPLDLDMLEEQIIDACIEVKTCDKRDAFKFEIIKHPDLSGNIPTKPACGVFTSQVIRHARICSKKDDLIEEVKSLTKKTTTQTLHHQWYQVITEEMSEETLRDHYQTGAKTSPEPHRRIMINILGILELPNHHLSLLLGMLECFTYNSNMHMYYCMKWLQLLGADTS